MQKKLQELPKLALDHKVENQLFFKKLKKKTPNNLDLVMQDLHEKVFEHTDCLACANCCKTASPIVTEKDIQRISKHLRLKETAFIDQYLFKDVDDFWAFRETPCPFLASDNYCLIYENRPKACSEYPHTNRRKFIQITDLTIKNTEICPATYEIVEALKKVKFEK
jgi:Fe-S-cluster containining protein